jgi:hypothetical protein
MTGEENELLISEIPFYDHNKPKIDATTYPMPMISDSRTTNQSNQSVSINNTTEFE